MRTSRFLLLSLATALVALGAVYTIGMRESSGTQAKVQEASAATMSPLAIPVVQPEAPAAPKAQVAPRSSTVTPNARLEQLVAQGPAGKFEAYRLVEACAPACPGLSPGTVTQRFQWIDEAAAAGVPGAYGEWGRHGPDGSGWEVALAAGGVQSPAVQQFLDKRDEYRAIALKNGDTSALLDMVSVERNSGNKVEALAYSIVLMRLKPEDKDTPYIAGAIAQDMSDTGKAQAEQRSTAIMEQIRR